jgi:hypothetical protein
MRGSKEGEREDKLTERGPSGALTLHGEGFNSSRSGQIGGSGCGTRKLMK